MSGTKAGAAKAMETIKRTQGNDFHARIGAKGGSVSGIAEGFALMPREKVSAAGKKGGAISRRRKSVKRAEVPKQDSKRFFNLWNR